MRSKKRNEEFPASCPLSFIPSEATELLRPPPPAAPPLPRLHSSVMAGDGVRRPGFLLINTWLHSERMNRICTCPYITLQMVGIMQPFVLGRRNEPRRELSLLAFSFLSFAFYSQLPHFLFSFFRFFFAITFISPFFQGIIPRVMTWQSLSPFVIPFLSLFFLQGLMPLVIT